MCFDTYLTRWSLTPDGEPITTPTSRLLPVRHDGQAAMLKVTAEEEECWGAGLLIWWDGDSAARVLAHAKEAVLLERATCERSLTEMARNGHDDEATRILCVTAARLHVTAGRPPPPPLIDLNEWFRELWPAAKNHGGLLAATAEIARDLVATQQVIVPLHGDIHHGNVLDGGERGWRSIRNGCEASGLSITSISSATRTTRLRVGPVASVDKSTSRRDLLGSEPRQGASPAVDPRLHRPLRRLNHQRRRPPGARPGDRRPRSRGAWALGTLKQ